MDIKAAIFDLDGTLVDSLMLWDVIWSSMGKRYKNDNGFRPTEADDKAVRTLTLSDAMELIHKSYKLGESGKELLDFVNGLMVDFYKNEVQLKSGVKEFLDCLKSQNVKMCVASATASELLEIAMEHCGLNEYFDLIFSCAQIGKGKDEPDIFLMAQEALGAETENTCVFEDSLVAIETAKKIGMKTVGIYDKYNYGGDRIRELADVYVGEGETLLKVVDL